MKHYTEKEWNLQNMLEQMSILESVDAENLPLLDAEHVEIYYPEGEYTFLHEAAIIEYHGVLYASWYNCTELELQGRTPIRGRRSYDGGKTWGNIEVIADDESGRIMYCPPVYGVCDDKLYMLINEMVAPDHMHALDLYVLNEETDRFEQLWSRPIPFKLNTNVYQLANGKLLLPGRIAELDQFPNTPAVMISDSGKIDAEWRVVNIAADGNLPDGHKLIHPELSAVIDGETVYIFCRDDEVNVPLLYISRDNGEHWTKAIAYDIPFTSSKIYSGTLSNGRNYVIGNIWSGEEWANSRSKLAIFFSKPGEFVFNEGYLLQDGVSGQFGYGQMWHYPVAHEANGNLYVIYTASVQNPKRGAVVSIIPVK